MTVSVSHSIWFCLSSFGKERGLISRAALAFDLYEFLKRWIKNGQDTRGS